MRRFRIPILVSFLAATLYLSRGLEFLDERLMDARFRLLERSATSSVAIVAMDAKSLAALEAWPWPRGYHATVIENLLAAGARRVAFDVDFSSRSIPEEDLELERALAASKGRVVLPVFEQWERDAGHGERLQTARPIPSFARHASLGSINIRPERNGLTRRYPFGGELDGESVPSFAATLAGRPPGGAESFYVDFGIAVETIPRVSYVDVLTASFDPALVKDRAVIVGATAVELGDQVAVPRYSVLPGCSLQALALESLVQGRALRRIGPGLIAFATLLIGVLAAPLIYAAAWRRGLAATLLAAVAFFLASLALQRTAALIVDASPWILTVLGAYGVGLVRRIDHQATGLLAQGVRILRTEAMMHHVVENSFDAIVTFGEDGRIETVNPAARRMFGLGDRSARHRRISELFAAGRRIETLPAGTGAPRETLCRREDGTVFPAEIVVSRIEAGEERKQVAFVRDITERKAALERLEHQARHDFLTGLPNRYSLRERLETMLAQARQDERNVALLLLDLDRFKDINDTLGHATGDRVLQKTAERLGSLLRSSDLLFRLGGDEFAVVMPDAEAAVAREMAGMLLALLEEPLQIDGLGLQVDTAIGIAVFPDHAADADGLVQRADVAMYVAKKDRSGVSLYHPDQDGSSLRLLTLTGDLREGIKKDQLSLHFQPKLSAATGRVVGVEALVRWFHPTHGFMRPDEFIGLAEHSGLIRPLTQWVLRSALTQAASWRQSGQPLAVSVNISARNLRDAELQGSLERLLDATGLDPSLLILEITESAIMEDPARALEITTALTALGVRISIDDFGTGYSSLAYLRRFPVSEIKIDKSFVMEMDRKNEDRAIVGSIVDLAHHLGLEVVAEGVETSLVWKTLAEMGCDLGQGYLFSKPVPADALLPAVAIAEVAGCLEEISVTA